MAGLPGKYLTMEHIIRRVYDETTQTLRTNSASGGATTVIIDAADDSIAIGDRDTGDLMKVNADGSINVQATEVVNSIYYGEINSVASGSYTTILSKTATSLSKLKLISTSGTNIAEYRVKLNSNIIDRKRTNFGEDLNCELGYATGILLNIGDILLVEVKHSRPTAGDFNAKFVIEE